MPLFGAHMSIAGGYYKAVDAAARCGMDVVQIFTKNNNQWRAKEISENEAADFRRTLAERNVSHPLSHSSYLLNLASPDATLRKKSVDACIVELQRAEQLGISYVVIHPGAHMGAGEEAGVASVVSSLNEIFAATRGVRCQILLESTAGQGSCLGYRFEHLAAMLQGVKDPERVAVCIDTCHLFAAGYPLGSRREYADTMKQFDQLIGLDQIRAIHLNDSRRELGSRVDRHDHIGRGHLGQESFRQLLNDPILRDVPMYLETPKGTENGEDLDVINLRTLRNLVSRRRRRA